MPAEEHEITDADREEMREANEASERAGKELAEAITKGTTSPADITQLKATADAASEAAVQTGLDILKLDITPSKMDMTKSLSEQPAEAGSSEEFQKLQDFITNQQGEIASVVSDAVEKSTGKKPDPNDPLFSDPDPAKNKKLVDDIKDALEKKGLDAKTILSIISGLLVAGSLAAFTALGIKALCDLAQSNSGCIVQATDGTSSDMFNICAIKDMCGSCPGVTLDPTRIPTCCSSTVDPNSDRAKNPSKYQYTMACKTPMQAFGDLIKQAIDLPKNFADSIFSTIEKLAEAFGIIIVCIIVLMILKFVYDTFIAKKNSPMLIESSARKE